MFCGKKRRLFHCRAALATASTIALLSSCTGKISADDQSKNTRAGADKASSTTAPSGDNTTNKTTAEIPDSLAPATVTLKITSPLNVTPLKLTLAFSVPVAPPKISDIKVDGGTVSNLAGAEKTYTADIVPTGEGKVKIGFDNGTISSAKDAASASAELEIVYDTSAPAAPTVSGTSPTSNTKPSWAWQASLLDAGSGVFRYRLDSESFTGDEPETTSQSYTPTTDLSVGDHILYVQERDAAGNWSVTASRLITIAAASSGSTSDTTPPSAPSVSAVTPTIDTAPTWTWSSGGGGNGTYRYKLDDATLASGATTTTVEAFTPASALSSSTHTLYVQERDAAGNWSASGSFAVTIDAEGPSAGNSGIITTASVTSTSLTLNWTAATDNRSAVGALQYLVYQSATNTISTVADTEAHGTPLGSFAAGLTTKPVTGLSPSTTYYYNVIVKDELGNKSVYASKTQVTTGDTTAPTATNYTITSSAVMPSTLTLTWTRATDDLTPAANLQYEVRRSASNNITTAPLIESNGTIVCAYAANANTCNVTGLVAGTTYYFNVIVKDAAVNKTAYLTVSVATTAATYPDAGLTNALGSGSQRKSFYDTVHGRHWAFYNTGSAIEYSYSTDNYAWHIAGTLAYGTADFSLSFKSIGGTAYVFVAAQANNYDIVMRRGALANTSITFAAEQIVFNGTATNDTYTKPSVALDANDILWVAAVHQNSTATANAYQAKARRSTLAADGNLSSWEPPTSLGDRSAFITDIALLPRTSNKLYLLVNSPQLIGYAFDGTSWSAANTGGSASWFTFPTAGIEGFEVLSILIAGSDVYVGGLFASAGGVAGTKSIAKWNGSTWSALGSGIDGQVSAMVMLGTDLIVGGTFQTIGANVQHLAKWNGSVWAPLGAGVDDAVYCLAVYGTDLYAGGDFLNAGGTLVNHIAKWNGSAWSALGSGLDPFVSVQALLTDGTDLYVGGEFSGAGGVTVSNAAKWNGSTWSALGTGMSGGAISSLAKIGSTLYAGGYFNQAGGGAAIGIAKWNGSAWSALGAGISGVVKGLAASGTDLYVVGSFSCPSLGISHFVKWDGNAWAAVDVSYTSGETLTVAASGSNVYVGTDSFIQMDSDNALLIAKWDGTAWSALGEGAINVKSALVVGSDLYVGGVFAKMGGLTTNNIAKWNGSAWSALGAGVDGAVEALASMGSNIVAAGSFSNAGGSGASNIAQWNGATWSALGAGVDANVYALAAIATDLYAGGTFANAGGGAAACIAKWNGTAWSALGTGMDSPVKALAAIGTDLYAGGQFSTAGGVAADYIAKWNGTTWSALGAGIATDTSNGVNALAVSGTDLFVGGLFTTAGSSTVNNVAKWNGSAWSPLGTGLTYAPLALAVVGSDIYAGGDLSALSVWKGSSWTSVNVPQPPAGLVAGNTYSLDVIAVGGTNLYFGSKQASFLSAYQTGPNSAIGAGGAMSMAAVSDTSTGFIYAVRASADALRFNSFNGTTWSATATTATTAASQSAMSIDVTTGNFWMFWIDGSAANYRKYTVGSGWGTTQALTAGPVVIAGLATDSDMNDSLIKVLAHDIGSAAGKLVVNTVN